MNNANQKQELMVKYEADGQEVKLTPSIVQNYLVGSNAKITMPEFKMFTELCKARKLNPFLKEAYLIKYSDRQPASIVVGKDAILKRAVRNKNYDGMESGIIVTNANDEITERKGTFKLPNETLVGSWARVYRKDWEHPIYSSVSFEEAAQKKNDGSLNSNWAKQPATMIEKVAKVRALREAFVEDLSGMYDADEMGVPNTSNAIKENTKSADDKVIEQQDESVKDASLKEKVDPEPVKVDMDAL